MKINFKALLKTFFFSFVWLTILLLFIDQVTKIAAFNANWNITLIEGFLYLHTTRNTGAAWSILDGKMWLLAIISAVVGIALIVYRIMYRKNLTALKKVLIAVILAGTWGNFIDRAFYKLILGSEGVVDFISFQFGSYYFPIFNVADICVTVGIISYAVLVFVEDYLKTKKEGQIAVVNEQNDHEINEENNDQA